MYLIFLLLILISLPANAMQKEVSLDYLVSRADVIAVVDIVATKNVGTLPSGTQVIANLVKINQPLKGCMAVGEKLKIKTKNIEDNPNFVKNERYLLFLIKEKNYYEIIAGFCGCWPLDNEGRILGYGTGKSIKDVEKAIDSAINNVPVHKEESKAPAFTL